MARGRMISKTISESKKFGDLQNHQHQLVYLMMLPWVDREGRMEADALMINRKVLMRLNMTEADVELALSNMHACGLITLYSTDGRRVLEICGFHRFNQPHHKEPASEFASPTQGVQEQVKHESSMAQARVNVEPSLPIIEVKESKGNLNESKGNEAVTELTLTTNVDLTHTQRTRAKPIAYQEYADVWNANSGSLPKIETVSRKRKEAIARLVHELGDRSLEMFRNATLAVAADEFWVERGYTIDNLLRSGRVVEKAEKFNRQGGLNEGNRRMAATAQRIARAIGYTHAE